MYINSNTLRKSNLMLMICKKMTCFLQIYIRRNKNYNLTEISLSNPKPVFSGYSIGMILSKIFLSNSRVVWLNPSSSLCIFEQNRVQTTFTIARIILFQVMQHPLQFPQMQFHFVYLVPRVVAEYLAKYNYTAELFYLSEFE